MIRGVNTSPPERVNGQLELRADGREFSGCADRVAPD